MDWNGIRKENAAAARRLLEEAGRLVFQARLEVARAGAGSLALESLEEAGLAVSRAAGAAGALPAGAARW